MTKEEYEGIVHKEIFDKNHRNQRVFTNEVFLNTRFEIVRLMDKLQGYINGQCRILVHCFWEPSGHAPKSQHYLGKACDFSLHNLPGMELSFLDHIGLVEEFLEHESLTEKVGLGIYPQWNYRGFHLDTRGYRARWGWLDGKQTEWAAGLQYVHRNHL